MKKLFFVLIFGMTSLLGEAQNQDQTKLFSDQQPLDLKLKLSLKNIKKKTNDSTYLDSWLGVKTGSTWDSVKVSLRARGLFRRANCYFAPIRIKMNKGNTKNTLMEGNKSLKLVVPCQNSDDKNTLVLKEYICYKIFEKITPYYFSTRLAHVDFTEDEGKKVKNFQLTGILIEDDNLVAKRHNAKVMEMKLHPLALNDTASLYHDIFQFMIGNTDWSSAYLHNTKLMYQAPKKYIPLAYDFDMSGFVNPSYAQVSPDLGISNVRQRLYRGFCRSNGATQYVRKQFIDKESEIMAILNGFEKDLKPGDFTDTKRFLTDFFTIMKSDNQFENYIGTACRKQ